MMRAIAVEAEHRVAVEAQHTETGRERLGDQFPIQPCRLLRAEESPVIRPIAVDVVDGEEFRRGLTAARAGAAVRIEHPLLERSPLNSPFLGNLGRVLPAIAAATLQMTFLVRRFPLPGPRLLPLQVRRTPFGKSSTVLLGMFGLPSFGPSNHLFSVCFVVPAARGGHTPILPDCIVD